MCRKYQIQTSHSLYPDIDRAAPKLHNEDTESKPFLSFTTHVEYRNHVSTGDYKRMGPLSINTPSAPIPWIESVMRFCVSFTKCFHFGMHIKSYFSWSITGRRL